MNERRSKPDPAPRHPSTGTRSRFAEAPCSGPWPCGQSKSHSLQQGGAKRKRSTSSNQDLGRGGEYQPTGGCNRLCVQSVEQRLGEGHLKKESRVRHKEGGAKAVNTEQFR